MNKKNFEIKFNYGAFLFIIFSFIISTLSACKSLDITQEQFEPVPVSRTIADPGVKNADSLFLSLTLPKPEQIKSKENCKNLH